MKFRNIAQLMVDLHALGEPATLVVNHTNLGEFRARLVDESGQTILDREGDCYLFALGSSVEHAVACLDELCD